MATTHLRPARFEPQHTNKRCTQTGKVKWYTEIDAKLAMANRTLAHGSNTRRTAHSKTEIRAYQCPHCDYWHTTSQTKRKEEAA